MRAQLQSHTREQRAEQKKQKQELTRRRKMLQQAMANAGSSNPDRQKHGLNHLHTAAVRAFWPDLKTTDELDTALRGTELTAGQAAASKKTAEHLLRYDSYLFVVALAALAQPSHRVGKPKDARGVEVEDLTYQDLYRARVLRTAEHFDDKHYAMLFRDKHLLGSMREAFRYAALESQQAMPTTGSWQRELFIDLLRNNKAFAYQVLKHDYELGYMPDDSKYSDAPTVVQRLVLSGRVNDAALKKLEAEHAVVRQAAPQATGFGAVIARAIGNFFSNLFKKKSKALRKDLLEAVRKVVKANEDREAQQAAQLAAVQAAEQAAAAQADDLSSLLDDKVRLTQQVADRDDTIAERDATIADLKRQLRDRTTQRAIEQTLRAGAERQVRALRDEKAVAANIAEVDAFLVEFDDGEVQPDPRIEQLTRERDAALSAAVESNAQVGELESENAALRAEVAALQRALAAQATPKAAPGLARVRAASSNGTPVLATTTASSASARSNGTPVLGGERVAPASGGNGTPVLGVQNGGAGNLGNGTPDPAAAVAASHVAAAPPARTPYQVAASTPAASDGTPDFDARPVVAATAQGDGTPDFSAAARSVTPMRPRVQRALFAKASDAHDENVSSQTGVTKAQIRAMTAQLESALRERPASAQDASSSTYTATAGARMLGGTRSPKSAPSSPNKHAPLTRCHVGEAGRARSDSVGGLVTPMRS